MAGGDGLPEACAELAAWRAQVMIWGYAVIGGNERAAVTAEGHAALLHGTWDGTAASIANQQIGRGDEPYRRVKDWAALPWAAEHMLRGHEPWAGL